MADDSNNKHGADELRKLSEKKVVSQQASAASSQETDTRRLLHELQVHQVELEMQNDEMTRTKLDLEATRDCYFDLYNLAPVGYLTLNKNGLIQRANLTASTMLGFEKNALVANSG